jgi:hypothetical protein
MAAKAEQDNRERELKRMKFEDVEPFLPILSLTPY